MKHLYKKATCFVLSALPLIAHAHPGHPDDERHVIGALIVSVAALLALKQAAIVIAKRAERIRSSHGKNLP